MKITHLQNLEFPKIPASEPSNFSAWGFSYWFLATDLLLLVISYRILAKYLLSKILVTSYRILAKYLLTFITKTNC